MPGDVKLIEGMPTCHIVNEIASSHKLMGEMVETLYKNILANEIVKLLHELKQRGIVYDNLSNEDVQNYIMEYQLLIKE